MSRRLGLPARADMLIALFCVLLLFSRLVLIFDVESVRGAAVALGYGRLTRWLIARALFCRVRAFPTAGQREDRPRRPCQELCMGRVVLPAGVLFG